VGVARYLQYQQRDQILAALNQDGVDISAGSVSDLAKLFTGYLRMLHDDPNTIARLRQKLEAEGGYWIHIDATGENGRGTTVAVYAGKLHWVLDVAKISTENAAEILVILRRVVERFGIPLAIMSDMGKGVMGAIKVLQEELGQAGETLLHLICHLHFVRDLGKDLLAAAHSAIGGVATNSKIRARLRAVERDLTAQIGDRKAAREQVNAWLEKELPAATPAELPPGLQGAAVLRSLLQWTLDYRVEGNDDFPFERPNLDFYARCVKACEILELYRQTPPLEPALQSKLNRFHLLVSDFCTEPTVVRNVKSLRARISLWEALRAALRLVPEGNAKSRTHIPTEVSVEASRFELQDIESAVKTLCDGYRAIRLGATRDIQKAIDIIVRHMDTYGHLLWGHVIELPDGRVKVLERTNNALETFWGSDKCGERHRSGHRTLTHDLETRSADALLAHNLECPDYVQLLCGTLEKLPEAFAGMDAELRRKALEQPKPATPNDALPRTVSEVIASRPDEETDRAQDRKLIRSRAFAARIELASHTGDLVPAAASGTAEVPVSGGVEPETSTPELLPPHETTATPADEVVPTTGRPAIAAAQYTAAYQLTFPKFTPPGARKGSTSPRQQQRSPHAQQRRGNWAAPSAQTSFQAFMPPPGPRSNAKMRGPSANPTPG
jgi:hypothetical protein